MKVLFLHQGLSSFVERDLAMLRSMHEVRALHLRSPADTPVAARGAAWADCSFSWFGKLHAFLGVLFCSMLHKPSIVVAGGDDVANEPDIAYGMFYYWWKKWCPLFVFRHADLILAVSKFNRQEAIQNARANSSKVRLLYHGFDPHRWRSSGARRTQRLVLTVGRVTHETVRKKGLALFVEAAAALPDTRFRVVGPSQHGAVDRLKALGTSNVTFDGGLYGDDLIQAYRSAKVYVQPSVHESFGCSVAEAMLCGCVPVVSRRAALPEVVGDAGLYLDELTPEALALGITEAFKLGPEWGRRARQRIIDLFPLEKRRAGLLAAVEEVTSS